MKTKTTKMKLLVSTLALLAIISCAGSALAGLLGVQPGLPQVSFNTGSASPATSYDPASGVLTVTAAPLSYRWSALAPVTITGDKMLTLRVHLDGAGKLVADAPGDGLVVTGTVSAGGQTYSGTLLTGKPTAFGFFNSTTTTDSFDFRLTTTGGELRQLWEGKDIGITLASESSTFNGSFAVGFHGNAKGTIGAIAGPYLTLAESCTDAQGEQPIHFSAVLTNTGSEALKNITCSAAPEAPLEGVPAELAIGASATITGSYRPQTSPWTGSITCSGLGSGSQVAITGSSSATCRVLTTAAFTLSASCADAPAPGQPIAISATITNTGNEKLTDFACSDDQGSAFAGLPATLAPGATAVITGGYLASASGSVDAVTCSARGAFDGQVVTGTSLTACNVVTHPALTVESHCADAPAPGLPITLSGVISNAGDEALTAITCSDSSGAMLSGLPTTLGPGASAAFNGSYLPTASPSSDTISCRATGSINVATVTAASSSTCSVLNPVAGCTYTLGYWKNHPERWPVGTLRIGSTSYTKAQLLAILQTPVKGNGLISLAHQLIAAKLNLAGGGSATPAVQAALQHADALIGSMVVPPLGGGYLAPTLTSTTEKTLDTYNNGLSPGGPGHC